MSQPTAITSVDLTYISRECLLDRSCNPNLDCISLENRSQSLKMAAKTADGLEGLTCTLTFNVLDCMTRSTDICPVNDKPTLNGHTNGYSKPDSAKAEDEDSDDDKEEAGEIDGGATGGRLYERLYRMQLKPGSCEEEEEEKAKEEERRGWREQSTDITPTSHCVQSVLQRPIPRGRMRRVQE